jgi:hypothetical protein
MQKSVFVFLALLMALVVPERVAQFITHSQAGVGVAWAQDADDSADVSALKVAPPDLQGTWNGQVDDDELGVASFEVDIFQKKSKIDGTYAIGGDVGDFKGKIASNGVTVTFDLKQQSSKCKIKASGTYTQPEAAVEGLTAQPQISGTYTAKKCSDISGGSFLITLTPDE